MSVVLRRGHRHQGSYFKKTMRISLNLRVSMMMTTLLKKK
jgi:hypothetical protein